jgi:hypothetical protein
VSFDGNSSVIVDVLRKLGIEPQERLSELDQDPEYTACRAEETSEYFALYQRVDVTPAERAVLCCFLLVGLNDYCARGSPHPLQAAVFGGLFAAGNHHAAELAYWTDTSDPDPQNWWPITSHLLAYAEAHGFRTGGSSLARKG